VRSGSRVKPRISLFIPAYKEPQNLEQTPLWQGLVDLEADDVEVTFGIKAVGEVGMFAVCKAGAEVNYEVKLKWSKEE
jgi:hypothetical protein